VHAGSGYRAAYQVSADDELPGTLNAILSQQARETWVALEIAEGTVAVGCALLTDAPPAAAPLSGLNLQRGNQRLALAALDLLSTERLDGHASVSDDLLRRLDWPTPVAGAHRAPLAEART
jgi:type VII secretion protein EccE